VANAVAVSRIVSDVDAAVLVVIEPPRVVRRKQEGQVLLQQSYMVLVQVRVRRLRWLDRDGGSEMELEEEDCCWVLCSLLLCCC